MTTRKSLTARAALMLLASATSFAANGGNGADASSDAQSMARDLLTGRSAHVASLAARPATTAARDAAFDAQQHAARLLTGSLSEHVARATSSPLTARNVDLQEAARHLLQGSSVD